MDRLMRAAAGPPGRLPSGNAQTDDIPARSGEIVPGDGRWARGHRGGGIPANEHGLAVAMCDHDGAMQVVGDEPIHHREGRLGATGGRGFEGGRAASPRQIPMYAHWVGWL